MEEQVIVNVFGNTMRCCSSVEAEKSDDENDTSKEEVEESVIGNGYEHKTITVNRQRSFVSEITSRDDDNEEGPFEAFEEYRQLKRRIMTLIPSAPSSTGRDSCGAAIGSEPLSVMEQESQLSSLQLFGSEQQSIGECTNQTGHTTSSEPELCEVQTPVNSSSTTPTTPKHKYQQWKKLLLQSDRLSSDDAGDLYEERILQLAELAQTPDNIHTDDLQLLTSLIDETFPNKCNIRTCNNKYPDNAENLHAVVESSQHARSFGPYHGIHHIRLMRRRVPIRNSAPQLLAQCSSNLLESCTELSDNLSQVLEHSSSNTNCSTSSTDQDNISINIEEDEESLNNPIVVHNMSESDTAQTVAAHSAQTNTNINEHSQSVVATEPILTVDANSPLEPNIQVHQPLDTATSTKSSPTQTQDTSPPVPSYKPVDPTAIVNMEEGNLKPKNKVSHTTPDNNCATACGCRWTPWDKILISLLIISLCFAAVSVLVCEILFPENHIFHKPT